MNIKLANQSYIILNLRYKYSEVSLKIAANMLVSQRTLIPKTVFWLYLLRQDLLRQK